MPIDYNAIHLAGGFGKGTPAAVQRAERRKARESVDELESRKVKARSGGACEIVVIGEPRCRRRAIHVHHLLSGIGVRGRGMSALAKNKVHVCGACHRAIHAHVLVPDGNRFRRWK